MKTIYLKLFILLTFLHFQVGVYAGSTDSKLPKFDPGPDLDDPMQKELLEIIDEMPFVPGISQALQVLAPSYKRGQKMRPDFGAMPLRGFLKPNSISVLVIGQDGTHIAEGANRPGIAGFGGRVHDMLKHFGIIEGVFFTNLYVNTISGQYGSRNTPVITDNKKIEYRNVIENRQWLMTHEGPYGKWRNKLYSWVIRNNKESLKMVMMLGQAGKDAGANFINSIGGEVSARSNIGDGSKYKVPFFKMVGAGGNNEWAVPVDANGYDIAENLRRDPKIRMKLISKLERKIKRLQKKIDDGAKGSKSSLKRIANFEKRIEALGSKIDYRDGSQNAGVSTANATDLLRDNFKIARSMMVFTEGGPEQNGVLTPEQFGGWDLRSMKVNGQSTRSIQGLKIPCNGSEQGACKEGDSIDAPDIVFVGSPHPTALSMGERNNRGSAAEKVERQLIKPLRAEMDRGWEPPQPEAGKKSYFLEELPYEYGRGLIPTSHGDPGITDLRLLPVSTAARQGKSTIVIGSRKNKVTNLEELDDEKLEKALTSKSSATFSRKIISKLERQKPTNQDLLDSRLALTGRPKDKASSVQYDKGPDEVFSRLLFDSLSKMDILTVKKKYQKKADRMIQNYLKNKKITNPSDEQNQDAYDRMIARIFKKHQLEAFDFKSHPDAGFFGHYRGKFDHPEVVILADPHGYDSFVTSKAMSGSRGQYLNGMMHDMGVGSNYLVLSTVPMAMDGATNKEWNAILEKTREYRKAIFAELKKRGKPVLFITDGKHAAKEIKELVSDDSQVINLKRRKGRPQYGIKQGATRALQSIDKYKGVRLSARMRDIPRSHLTWIARVWEGTSGDRVVTAVNPHFKGKAFAIVAPHWATRNDVELSAETRAGVDEMIQTLLDAGEPHPDESIEEFNDRKNTGSDSEVTNLIFSEPEISNVTMTEKSCNHLFRYTF